MRVLLVVNPSASRVTERRQRLVERLLGDRHDVATVSTSGRDHATALARAALEPSEHSAPVDCVVVLAGDGTLNEVVTGLAGSELPVAALPGGSTNVFCRTIGIPDDLRAATTLVSDAIARRQHRRIGLGSVDGRYFLLHTGIGWDAELVSIVERHAPLKRRLGHALFVGAGLRAFFWSYDRRRPHFAVTLPDGTVIPDGYFAVVLNSDPYTFVHTRPFTVSPRTTLDSPLTLVVARSMKVRDFIRLPADALTGGRGVAPGPHLAVHPDLEELTITRRSTCPPPAMPYQVDGDHLGDAAELTFHHHPDVLTIVTTAEDAHG